MMGNDLISVIVPCYNIENYVERCIKSIVNQTYKNIEIIAIDDGSEDKTSNILDEIALLESNVKVFHFLNEGPSSARNHGLEQIKGQYVMFVDGDDFLDLFIIERMYNCMKKNNLDIAACNYTMYYNEDKLVIGNIDDSTNCNERAEDFVKRLFDPSKRFCSVWAKMYKKEMFNDIKYPSDVFFGEDMYVAPILFDKAKKVGYLNEPMYFYNQQGVSLVRSKFNVNKLKMVDAALFWVSFCKEKYPTLIDLAKSNYYSTLINICTHLSSEKELYGYYEKYRTEIKTNIKEIKSCCIYKKDSIKAIMICIMKPYTYNSIRNLLLKPK